MVAPSLKNVAGYREVINYIDANAATSRLTTVANTSGSTLAKGSVVFVFGSSDGVPSVRLAKADAITTLPAFGILPKDILAGTTGICNFSGALDGIDTSAFSVGDKLYVSDIGFGGLVNAEPIHPSISQLVAVVTFSDVKNGSIFIFPCYTPHGQEAGTLNDIFKIGSGSAGNKILQFTTAFTGALGWNPTAARVVFIPDVSGDVGIIQDGGAGIRKMSFLGASPSFLSWTPTSARTLSLPDATDTLIGKATVDTLTHKTFDSAGTGNVLKINGVIVPAPATLTISSTSSASGSTAPSGGVGTAAGGWDTAANRDLAIAAINANAAAINTLTSAINANAAAITALNAAVIGAGIGST